MFEAKIPGLVTKLNLPGCTSAYNDDPAVNTAASFSFITQLIPQFEEGDLYESIEFDLNPFVGTNGKYACTPLSVLQCPSFTGKRETIGNDYVTYTDSSWAAARKPMLTQYVAMGATTRENLFRDGGTPFKSDTLNGEPDGFIYSTVAPIRDGTIADGMAKTIMLVETMEERYATWMDGTTASVFGIAADGQTTLNRGGAAAPYMSAANFGGTEDWQWGPSSMHGGKAHHAFGDGAVRAISDEIEADVYRALITRASKVQYGVSDAETAALFFDE